MKANITKPSRSCNIAIVETSVIDVDAVENALEKTLGLDEISRKGVANTDQVPQDSSIGLCTST
jgi:hypothetical protein